MLNNWVLVGSVDLAKAYFIKVFICCCSFKTTIVAFNTSYIWLFCGFNMSL